jgi:hypothetical protein
LRGKLNKKKNIVCSFSEGNATDELDDILIIAAKTELQTPFSSFKSIKGRFEGVDFRLNLKLDKLFEGVSLMAIIAIKWDQILAQGECSRQNCWCFC